MKNHSRLLPAIVLTAALSTLSLGLEAKAQAPSDAAWSGDKWEYRVVRIADANPEVAGRNPTARTGDAQAELNRLGQKGWELVAVRTDATSARSNPIFYFKRPAK